MRDACWQDPESKYRRAAARRWQMVLLVITAAACTRANPEPSQTQGHGSSEGRSATADLDGFWSSADDTVHDVQRSIRSARLIAHQLGGDAATGNYDEVIALGHRLGGLGHDHVRPADGAPVVPMLDTMIASVETLIQLAATAEELENARSATDATVTGLPVRTQRLYHLIGAKKKLVEVRSGAVAIGFPLRPSSPAK